MFRREIIEGIRVNRVWLYPSHDASGRRRALTYLSFAFSALMLGPWVTRRPDVIYVYHPPATVALPAKWISFLKRVPTVYDIQDLWPDSVLGTGMMPRRLARLLDRYCNWVHRKMDRLVVLSQGFRRTLIDRGIDPARIDVVANWCDEKALRPDPYDKAKALEFGFDASFNVLFAGTMGVYQALDTILEAARELHSRGADTNFLFIGGGTERDRLRERARELPNVRFLDQRPMEEMPAVIACADALLVHLKDDPLFEITIPSKIQAYMYAGRPILAGVKGDAAELVREAGAGLPFLPGNPASLVEAVSTMAAMSEPEREQMARNGVTYYEKEMSLSRGVDRFEAIFNDLERRQKREKIG